MDSQRKKGVLDVLVLSILNRGPSYGYEIIRQVSSVMEVAESTMYPILRRLENGGDLETYSQEHNGRVRKYFSITDKGRARIATFLEEWDEMKAIYEFVKNGKGEEADE